MDPGLFLLKLVFNCMEACVPYLLFVNGLQWLFAVNSLNYIYLKAIGI